MSQRVDAKRFDSGGEIACGSSAEGGHSAISISPQKEFYRGEKNNQLLH